MIDERNENMSEEIISTKEVNTSLYNYENSRVLIIRRILEDDMSIKKLQISE